MAMASSAFDIMTESPETEADVFSYLRERELGQTVYTSGDPKLVSRERNATVERLMILAAKLELGWTTRAAAVAYFDGALCELTAIPANALPLLAAGSLLVAAKMEEEEINVPTVSSVLQAAESTDTMQELNVMELLILKVWKWNVCVVTPAHFIPFYARIARVYDTAEPHPTEPVMQPEKGCVDVILTDEVTRLACCIAEGASLDATALEYRPSILAASAVAVARMHCGLSPHWPHTLSALMGFSTDDGAPPVVLDCCRHLLRLCQFGEESAYDFEPTAEPPENKVFGGGFEPPRFPLGSTGVRQPFRPVNMPSSIGASKFHSALEKVGATTSHVARSRFVSDVMEE